jgi:CheY-like chemotaxis protein
MNTYLIDDDHISNFLTEKALKREGFSNNIASFLSGEEAFAFLVENLAAQIPDVVFLDLNMPVMNGWEFLEALKPYEDQLTGRCHIYILTSSLALSDTARSKDYALVSGLIHKPLDREDIQTILSQLEDEAQYGKG